jgi:hypothetical protein
MAGTCALRKTVVASSVKRQTGTHRTLLADPDDPAHLFLPLICRSPRYTAEGPSKLGVHTILQNNAVTFVEETRTHGAQVALVKALDIIGYLRDVKTVSPGTTTIARWNYISSVDPVGDPRDAARWILKKHMPEWRPHRDYVDYWEVLNEVDPPTTAGHVWLSHFFVEAMNIAEANGYKLALFSYSVGVPEWYEWEAIVQTGVFARAQQGGHILALHEYNWPIMSHRWGEAMPGLPAYEDRGVLTGRYRYLYEDFLIPRGEVIPLALTECGLDPVLWEPGQPTTWEDRFVDEMIWYDTRLREDEYVLGAGIFTIGGAYGWEPYDYEDFLGVGDPDGHNLLNYIVSLKDA